MYFYKLCAFLFMLMPITTCDGTAQQSTRDVSIRRLLYTQKFNTGYAIEQQQSEIDLKHKSDKDIVEMERLQYKRLKCSYIFNALIHLHLTRNVIRENNPRQLRLINMNSISYVNEATRMIYSLLRVKQMNLNEIWLVYEYAKKIRQYFSSIRADPRPRTLERIDVQLGMHDFVADKLRNYTKSKCEPENFFNANSTKCYMFLTHSQFPDENYADITVRQVVVNENKLVLNDMLWENVALGLNYYVGEVLTDDHLYLLNVDSYKTIMDVFLNTFSVQMNWGNVWERLKEMRQNANKPGVKGIVSLLQYQRMFIDIIQTNILRITWKHMMYLNVIRDQIKNKYDKYVKSYYNILNGLVTFLHINNSPCFEKLLKYFKSELPSILANKDSIISIIIEQLSTISKNLGCNCTKPLKIDSTNSKESVDNTNFVISIFRTEPITTSSNPELIDDSLLSARAYLDYLKYIFKTPYKFEVVQSFNKLFRDAYLSIS